NNAGMIACLINHGIERDYQHLADIVIEELSQLQPLLTNNSTSD
ncbi:HAD family hydrolase, partial [Shewanella sp. SR41-2]|nr:HAD family hydrolase [Shewanella sp. SR41-2]